jgi:hypothetical protein
LNRNQLAIGETDREDLAFDGGEIKQIASGQVAERDTGDARVHVMDVISKTPPDSTERFGTLRREDLVFDESCRQSRSITVSLDVVALEHEPPNAFRYSKREYSDHRPYFFDLDVDTLAPDFPMVPTWAEYLAGRDSAMEAIQDEIARRASKRTGKKSR